MDEVEKLIDELKLISKYGSALAVLGWDEEVNLPSKAHNFRGEVNALLGTELHKRVISPDLYARVQHLKDPKKFNNLSSDNKIIVREASRDIELARKLPASFIEELTILTTKAFEKWVEARASKDFKIFAPVLKQVIELKKREAELLGYKKSPYDALLDEYEPGMTVNKLDKIFKPLSLELTKLISSAKEIESVNLPVTKYPIEAQTIINNLISKQMGYDLDSGRIDVSPHPFTTSFHPTDVRITTRYDESDFWVSLGSTIHEVGHALYEQGLPQEHFGTPLGEAISLGVHESQSRAWENFVGRSKEFVSYLYPILKEYFPNVKYSESQLYKWLNRVSPNLIRVESDEVTYNMHIILRYELEKALIEGQLIVEDLPKAWNEKINHYLGLSVPDDAQGVLQDVHWSHGSFGYFPTYTLGNIYSAQFHNTAIKNNANLENDFKKGDFSKYLNWLRINIHKEGRRYSPAEIVERVTGEGINSQYLLDHLAKKVENLKS